MAKLNWDAEEQLRGLSPKTLVAPIRDEALALHIGEKQRIIDELEAKGWLYRGGKRLEKDLEMLDWQEACQREGITLRDLPNIIHIIDAVIKEAHDIDKNSPDSSGL